MVSLWAGRNMVSLWADNVAHHLPSGFVVCVGVGSDEKEAAFSVEGTDNFQFHFASLSVSFQQRAGPPPRVVPAPHPSNKISLPSLFV